MTGFGLAAAAAEERHRRVLVVELHLIWIAKCKLLNNSFSIFDTLFIVNTLFQNFLRRGNFSMIWPPCCATHLVLPLYSYRDRRMQLAEWLVFDLRNPDFRENALVELSKRRELFHDLAPVLWSSFGTTTILLQEIICIYPFLSPPNLTPAQSNRVCNVLALLQCVASHSDTKMLLLNAKIPLYLYPFLDTTSESRPFEYLRLTSLGVIGALVKADDTEVVRVLLPTAIIPRCLRAM